MVSDNLWLEWRPRRRSSCLFTAATQCVVIILNIFVSPTGFLYFIDISRIRLYYYIYYCSALLVSVHIFKLWYARVNQLYACFASNEWSFRWCGFFFYSLYYTLFIGTPTMTFVDTPVSCLFIMLLLNSPMKMLMYWPYMRFNFQPVFIIVVSIEENISFHPDILIYFNKLPRFLYNFHRLKVNFSTLVSAYTCDNGVRIPLFSS